MKKNYTHTPKLGTGKRFANLEHALAAKGIRDPKALAASIGRKKLGNKRFAALAAKSRASESRKPS